MHVVLSTPSVPTRMSIPPRMGSLVPQAQGLQSLHAFQGRSLILPLPPSTALVCVPVSLPGANAQGTHVTRRLVPPFT